MRRERWLAAELLLLGAVVAVTAVLGPLVAELIRYRTSPTTLNQIIGGDAAALAVVAPLSLVVAVLALRRHPAAPVLALAPGTFALYTFAQLVVGQEYLRLPGNNEHFFPLLLAGFVVAGLIAVTALHAVDPGRLPRMSRRLAHLTGGVLLVVAAYLVLGLHLPTLVDAWRETPTRVEYLSSPTAFWVVKLMDLGIVVPAAVVAAAGLLRGAPWACKPAYAIVGAYTLLATSVAGMAVTMYINHDPDASLGTVAAFTVFALAFAALATALYRPLLRASRCVVGDAGQDRAGRPPR